MFKLDSFDTQKILGHRQKNWRAFTLKTMFPRKNTWQHDYLFFEVTKLVPKGKSSLLIELEFLCDVYAARKIFYIWMNNSIMSLFLLKLCCTHNTKSTSEAKIDNENRFEQEGHIRNELWLQRQKIWECSLFHMHWRFSLFLSLLPNFESICLETLAWESGSVKVGGLRESYSLLSIWRHTCPY